MYVPGAQRPEEGAGSPGTGLTIQMWVLGTEAGCQQEQPVLLPTEPPL